MASNSQAPSPQSNGAYVNGKGAMHGRLFTGCSSIRDYEIMGKLGEGTFGEVHRARSRKTGAVVALKKILMHNEKDGFPITALREIKLLKLLDHPNILRLEEMAVEHHQKVGDKRKKSIMYMVTPYMDHDLSGLLENPSVVFTEPQIKCYLLQLLEGLKYLHGEKILHRDMKAANLLINNKGILQIADFGLARHYSEPAPVSGNGGGEAVRDYTTLVVTRWYRPPELLMHMKKYTTAIDLWGVGCVFGEMLNGKPIMAGDSDLNQLKLIFELVGTPNDQTMPGYKSLPGARGLEEFGPRRPTLQQRFRAYGTGAISLLSELLKLDWRKRINAIDALKHPYFLNEPLPARPGDIPVFEESHELDRRKFRNSHQGGPPPAPKGGTVGNIAGEDWQAGGGRPFSHQRYDGGSNRSYAPRRPHHNGHPPRSQSHYNNGTGPPCSGQRRPAWERDGPPPDARPRPPSNYHSYAPRKAADPGDLAYHHGDGDSRGGSQDRGFPPPPRSGAGGSRGGPNVDTYIPNYAADPRGLGRDRRESYERGGDRRSRDRDERMSRDRDDRRSRDREERERWGDRDRDRDRRTTRSRSPGGGRDHRDHRDHRDRDGYRR